MKLVTFSGRDPARLGRIDGDRVIDLNAADASLPRDMIALIDDWRKFRARVAQVSAPALALKDVHLHAPIPRPGKILAIGLNYADHVAETRRETPKHQTWFCKMPTAANGPYDPVDRPKVSEQLDYEAELVVVIGKRCRHVSEADAAGAIFGYCVGNDLSVRDWQWRTPQWMIGKSFDTHAPFGPAITTVDEIGDAPKLRIRALVNGETLQDSNTGNLIFPVAAMIAHLSQVMTLEPGDIIFTGTPSGVGAMRKPPLWLKPGDIVRVEIEKLGHIENKVRAEP